MASSTNTITGEVTETGTEIATVDAIDGEILASGVRDLAGDIAALRDPGATLYTSIAIQSQADTVRTMKALTNSVKLEDDKGKVYDGIITLQDVIVQKVELTDDKGKLIVAPRVVLIDADGTAYHATSTGLLSALQTLFGVAGTPDTWDAAYQIRVEKAKSRNGFFYFTIVFV